ncbi:MAG: VapE domain-containing protein [Cyanobacteriota bacterium]
MNQATSPHHTATDAPSGDQLASQLHKRSNAAFDSVDDRLARSFNDEVRSRLKALSPDAITHLVECRDKQPWRFLPDELQAAGRSRWDDLSPEEQAQARRLCIEGRQHLLAHRQQVEQGRAAKDLTAEQQRGQGLLSDAFNKLRLALMQFGELVGLEPSTYYVPAISPSLQVEIAVRSRLTEPHRRHLQDELGDNGPLLATIFGARSIDADEAEERGFRYKNWRGGGLLLPFGGDFAQLRCDDPPIDRTGDSVKYLNRKGGKQQPGTFGASEPTIATEGWKDALCLHLATGETVQAIPGVTAWRQLAPTIELLIYDADAALNPAVWGPLIRAGIDRPALRLAFFPREVAGDKGGACEFFNAGGVLADAKRWKARELLRELPGMFSKNLRVDWHELAVRRLAALAQEAGLGNTAAEQLACSAARAIGLPVATARALTSRTLATSALQPQSGAAPSCPEEPTKRQLQEFLRQRHQIRFNSLSQLVEIDGQPAEDIDLADSLLAHLHGIETTKQAARDSLTYVGKSNVRNPIADYLAGLRETPGLSLLRIEEIAGAFGITPEEKLSQELLARHLAGAYLRGMTPGHKHDQMLILCGYQGQGKGEAIKALFSPALYGSATRVVKGLEDREFLTTLNSVWGFEFDECEKALLGRDASEFKGFTTRNTDRYVQKYETVSKEHPRRSVLFGTSNETEILNDSTGSRRYWLIDVRGGTLDPAWIRENRDSIWATVSTWVGWGLENWLPPHSEAAALAAERASGARLSDPWEGPIAAHLDGLLPEGDGIAQEDLISQSLQVDQPIKVDRNVQMRVARIVTASDFLTHGGKVRWTQKKRRYGGGPPRSGYVPEPVPIVPNRSELVRSSWNGQKPWENKDLASLFQPFQPFEEEYQESPSACMHAEGGGLGERMSPVVAGFEPVGQNGRNGTEIPFPDCDLPFQSSMEHPAAASPPQSPLLSTVSHLPAATHPAATSAAIAPAASPSPSDVILTSRERVQQALQALKPAPSAPSAAVLVAQRTGVPRARVKAVLQELTREEREAEQPGILAS